MIAREVCCPELSDRASDHDGKPSRAPRQSRPQSIRRDFAAALAGLLAAGLPLAWLSGFTVDDAFIVARYAAHVANGVGYRFNHSGPPTDGVTPLGLPWLLAPFAQAGTLAAFRAARALGALAWLSASSVLGIAVGRASDHPARWASLALIATSASTAAWSASGMETGLAVTLTTLAVCLPLTPRLAVPAAALGGLLAWLRPEALPLALVLGVGRARSTGSRVGSALAFCASGLPFVLTAAVRMFIWARPYPLALLAKPSDLHHGIVYAAAAGLLGGGSVVIGAPWFRKALGPWQHALVVGAVVHTGAVIAAGGDWMPLSRLFVPLAPVITLLAAHELSARPRRPTAAMLLLSVAVAGQVFAAARVGTSASRVLPVRLALIEQATTVLARYRAIASVDIGWLGAATRADIIDLAGVTDPTIAVLPGGHTSKRVSGEMLAERGVDAILVWCSAPTEPRLAASSSPSPRDSMSLGDLQKAVRRGVERQLLADPVIARDYSVVWTSDDRLPTRYALLARREGDMPPQQDASRESRPPQPTNLIPEKRPQFK